MVGGPSFAFNQYWFGKLANIHCSVLMTGCFDVKVATTEVIFQQLLNYFLLFPRLEGSFLNVSVLSLNVGQGRWWTKVGWFPDSFHLPPSDNPDNTQWNLLPFKWGEGESKYWLICCFQLSVAFSLWGLEKLHNFNHQRFSQSGEPGPTAVWPDTVSVSFNLWCCVVPVVVYQHQGHLME